METTDKNEANRFLSAIEDGSVPEQETHNLISKCDPLLAHFLLRYLKEKHPVDGSGGAGMRLLDLLREYPHISNLALPPKGEPMVEWFNDSYSMSNFFKDPSAFVDLIVDKLDG